MSIAAVARKTIVDLASPKGLPVIGNFHQIDIGKFHRHLEQWSDELGPIFKFRMGPVEIVAIADTDTINSLLRDRPDGFRRRRTIENIISELGFNGVFSSEGERWKRQRKVVALALNSAHLHRFFPQLLATTERLKKRWDIAAEQGATVDLSRDVMRYTVDVTTQLAFGVDVNTLETDGPVIQQQLDKVFPMLGRRINAPFPYWRYFRLPKDRELDRAMSAIRETVNGFIAACRERMAADPSLYEQPTNFLEAIIAAQRVEVDAKFTDDDIYANVLTLLLAGEDTTANTIAWAGNFFIEHPRHYKRARVEIDSVVGDASTITNQEQLSQVPFLEAIANETMRLKPVGPLFPLETLKTVELMGYELPPRTPVIALTRYAAVDANNFSAPEQFNPERWLTQQENADSLHNAQASIPFGTGPRFCPGRNLALAEIKMALAMLCRNFDLELSDPSRAVEERLTFAMVPKNLMVNFSKRQGD